MNELNWRSWDVSEHGTCVASFVKIGSGIQQLIGVTDRQEGNLINLLFSFRRESRLITEFYAVVQRLSQHNSKFRTIAVFKSSV
jgi:hypothetical protein